MRISNGDKGPLVRLLQESLVSAGFDIGIDGDFGNGTEAAVREFQRSMGLKVDGVVGPRTASLLGVELGDRNGPGHMDEDFVPQPGGFQGTNVVFDDESVPADVKRLIDECARPLREYLVGVLQLNLSALNNVQTKMTFASGLVAQPDILGALSDHAFEFATRRVAGLVTGGDLLLDWINVVRDELFRAAAAGTSASVGDWIVNQRRVLEHQREEFGEAKIAEELTLFYLAATDRPARVAELLEVRASVGFMSLPQIEDLELIMYETWINAHFVRIGADEPGCIAYRFLRDDDRLEFLALTVEAPQPSAGQLEGALNGLFDSGRLTLASTPIDMAVRKRVTFRTTNFVGGTGDFTGWLASDNKTLHRPLKEEAVFDEHGWRMIVRRFKL